MDSIISKFRDLLGMRRKGSTRVELQLPKNTGEYDGNEYEKFEEYIAALRLKTLEELIIPVIMLFSERDILHREKDDSIGERRLIVRIQTGPGLFKCDEGYREIYAGIYEQITPTLLTILVNWFSSIAFPPKQEQTGQTDNPNSILKKIIDIINSSNSDKRRELVLELLEAIGFSSDQSIKGYEDTHLKKEPQEEPQESELSPIDQKSQAQGLTLKYIIYLLEEIFDFKLQSGEYLLDWIFQSNQNPPGTNPSEIKDLLKLILLWNRWCKLKPDTEKLPSIKEKIESKTVLEPDIIILNKIINGARPDLFLLKPESEEDSLLRNLIQIIVTNSFGEIYQEARKLYHPAKLVIFEKNLEKLKNVTEKEKTDSWFGKLEELLNAVAQDLHFLFKEQVNENPEIALSYAGIFYKIWLLIIEFKNLKIKLRLPKIRIFCNARKTYLESIQGVAKTINERENSSKIEKLTQIINFINEYLTLLYRLFGNGRTVRTVFLDSLKFLENPDLDRVKQKLQEITDLLNEILGLLDIILIKEEIQKLKAQIAELEKVEAEIQKLKAQIAELEKTIAVTISDPSFAPYTGATQKLSNLQNGANPNQPKTRLSRLFSLRKR